MANDTLLRSTLGVAEGFTGPFLAALVQASDDAMLGVDGRGVILCWNRAAVRLFGHGASNIVGQPFALLWPAHLHDEVGRLMERLRQGERIANVETVYRHRDGHSLSRVSTLTPTRSPHGALLGFSVVVSRQGAEEALANESAHWRAVLETVGDAILTLDMHGRIQAVNPATCDQFGYVAEELLGRPVALLLAATGGADHVELLERALAGSAGQLVRLADVCIGRHRDGRTFPVQLAAGTVVLRGQRYCTEVVRAAGQRPPHEVVGQLTDVTALKAGESERLNLNTILARKNRELRLVLQRAQRLTSLGTLAAGLAHEINNPLTSLRLSLYALGSSLGDGAEANEEVRTMTEEVARLEQIARKYLDYSRGKTQALSIEEIAPLLDSAASLLAHQAHQARVEVVVAAAPDVPAVRVDAGQIKQVLLNLLQNALDSVAGGGQICLSADTRADEHGRAWVVIAVTDTGAGLPAELMPLVFEPFFSTKTAGAGLGLYVSRQLAEQHGGRLVLEAAGPPRTCFALWLPPATADENDPHCR